MRIVKRMGEKSEFSTTVKRCTAYRAERSSRATLSTTKRARWSGGRQSPKLTKRLERLGVVHGFERSTHMLKYSLCFYNSE
jgi:hypothetical protein